MGIPDSSCTARLTGASSRPWSLNMIDPSSLLAFYTCNTNLLPLSPAPPPTLRRRLPLYPSGIDLLLRDLIVSKVASKKSRMIQPKVLGWQVSIAGPMGHRYIWPRSEKWARSLCDEESRKGKEKRVQARIRNPSSSLARWRSPRCSRRECFLGV